MPLALLGIATIALSLVALALEGRDNGAVRFLSYAAFAAEVLYLSYVTIDSMLGTSTFFLLAGLVVAVLAANEVWHFVPDQYVSFIVYLAGALGLYGLRDAVERLKQKLDQIPSKS